MSTHNQAQNRFFAGLYREPRRTRVSWALLVLALLWLLVGLVTTSSGLLLLAPIPLLMTVADVLPGRRVRVAVTLRVIAVLYMIAIPTGYLVAKFLW